jgi:hypothetical protein
MLSAFAKLFAIRPLLSMAILGVPVLTLIAIGFFALWAFKILIFVVLPIVLVVWLIRRITRPRVVVAAAEPAVNDM